jgi:hypothetical protein
LRSRAGNVEGGLLRGPGRQFPILGRMARALKRCSFDSMHGGRGVVVYSMGCEGVPVEGEAVR